MEPSRGEPQQLQPLKTKQSPSPQIELELKQTQNNNKETITAAAAAAAMRELLLAPSPSFSSPSPSPQPVYSPRHASIDLSPPLIAMVVVVCTAFLIVLYTRVISRIFRRLHRRFRRWRCRRRLLQFTVPSPMMTHHDPAGATTISFGSSSDYFIFSPYGLDDSSIKSLPTSLFSKSKAKHLACTNRDCAVCLLEFEDDDCIRTLPYCSHAFHVECIDVWLRSHATCPLCRASVFRPELNFNNYSPFVPMRASRIRPSLDEIMLYPPQDLSQLQPESISELEPEIVPANAVSPPPTSSTRADFNLVLKRSYSFGFERSLARDRMVLEASTASPWRFRQHHHRNSFWSKRWPSPFHGSTSASRSSRVFSFRSYRAIKSPFSRRRTESSIRLGHGGPSLSSRRARSMTSPSMNFLRPPSSSSMGCYSSRMRCGDPEALLSPERLNNSR